MQASCRLVRNQVVVHVSEVFHSKGSPQVEVSELGRSCVDVGSGRALQARQHCQYLECAQSVRVCDVCVVVVGAGHPMHGAACYASSTADQSTSPGLRLPVYSSAQQRHSVEP